MHDTAPNDIHSVGLADGTRTSTLHVGARVCVWNHFLDRWCGGFEVAEEAASGYRLRRVSDGYVLPDVFAFDDVLVERRRNNVRGIEGSHLDRRHDL